jgi:hypothetical protein
MGKITSLTKEGSTIVILVDEREQPFKYDCKNNTLYSFTGRAIKRMNPILNNAKGNRGQGIVIDAIRRALKGEYALLKRIELFMSCLDLVWTDWDLPDECPKGYIKWVKANNKQITRESLAEFKKIEFAKTAPKELVNFLNSIPESAKEDMCLYRDFINNYTIEQKMTVVRIFKSSVKEVCWSLAYDMDEFFRTVHKYRNRNIDFSTIVDTNRNFEKNKEILENFYNQERNQKVIEFEKQFTEIENLSDDTYTIIVPTTIEEFNNEGKQQNNCVGYFYHDSIARHMDIVYFIRKKTNENHSYITNRFSVFSNKTCETRMVNNNDNSDKCSLELIKKIDEKIKEILEKIGETA